jgi:hypothetical protein
MNNVMNKRINLVLTPEEEAAIQSAIKACHARGILLSRTAAVRSFMWMGIHQLNQLASKQQTTKPL